MFGLHPTRLPPWSHALAAGGSPLLPSALTGPLTRSSNSQAKRTQTQIPVGLAALHPLCGLDKGDPKPTVLVPKEKRARANRTRLDEDDGSDTRLTSLPPSLCVYAHEGRDEPSWNE